MQQLLCRSCKISRAHKMEKTNTSLNVFIMMAEPFIKRVNTQFNLLTHQHCLQWSYLKGTRENPFKLFFRYVWKRMRSINGMKKMKFDHVSELCKSLHSSLRSSPQWFTAIPKDDASSRGVNCNQKYISADVNIGRVCRYFFRTIWCVDSRAFAAQRSSRRRTYAWWQSFNR